MADKDNPLANSAPETAELCLRKAAAEYISTNFGFPCSPAWLAKLAVTGGGPPFYKAGRTPVYPKPGLNKWAQARLGRLVRSTSEATAASLPPQVA